MKTKISNEDWYYEFSPLSSISPNGQFTVKTGTHGVPICIIPMPLGGGIDAKEKQEQKAKLIAAIPIFVKACLKVTESPYGCGPSVGYMDEMKLLCETALIQAGRGRV